MYNVVQFIRKTVEKHVYLFLAIDRMNATIELNWIYVLHKWYVRYCIGDKLLYLVQLFYPSCPLDQIQQLLNRWKFWLTDTTNKGYWNKHTHNWTSFFGPLKTGTRPGLLITALWNCCTSNEPWLLESFSFCDFVYNHNL